MVRKRLEKQKLPSVDKVESQKHNGSESRWIVKRGEVRSGSAFVIRIDYEDMYVRLLVLFEISSSAQRAQLIPK